jgi:hypothetical protein
MATEQRASARVSVTYPCLVDRGPEPPAAAKLTNISKAGANLISGITCKIGDDLILYMTRDGSVARKCRVMWQTGDAIGLQFTGERVSKPAWIEQGTVSQLVDVEASSRMAP